MKISMIVLLSVVVRLAMVASFAAATVNPHMSADYTSIARSIHAGHGYALDGAQVNMYFLPGYAYFRAALCAF